MPTLSRVSQLRAESATETVQESIPNLERVFDLARFDPLEFLEIVWREGRNDPYVWRHSVSMAIGGHESARWDRHPFTPFRHAGVGGGHDLGASQSANRVPGGGVLESEGKRGQVLLTSNWANVADFDDSLDLNKRSHQIFSLIAGTNWQKPHNTAIYDAWRGISVGASETLERGPVVEFARMLKKGDSVAFKHELEAKEIARNGRPKVAERLRYLRQLCETEPDEPELNLSSVRNFRAFIANEKNLPDPNVFLTSEGLALAEWGTNDGGIVALEFWSDGWIQFAGVTPKVRQGDDRGTIQGVYRKRGVLSALKPFLWKLTAA